MVEKRKLLQKQLPFLNSIKMIRHFCFTKKKEWMNCVRSHVFTEWGCNIDRYTMPIQTHSDYLYINCVIGSSDFRCVILDSYHLYLYEYLNWFIGIFDTNL